MGKFTKFVLLLITIVVISQVSFGGGIIADIDKLTASSAIYHTLPNTTTSTVLGSHKSVNSPTDFESISDQKEIRSSRELSRHTKKYRQTSVYPSLKIPVKYLDEVSVFINSITTYSRPYFLTHLHRFLFRLTPF